MFWGKWKQKKKKEKQEYTETVKLVKKATVKPETTVNIWHNFQIMKQCQDCGHLSYTTANICPECGSWSLLEGSIKVYTKQTSIGSPFYYTIPKEKTYYILSSFKAKPNA